MHKHPCKLVPRLLPPRWNCREHIQNMLKFSLDIEAEEVMLFPVCQFIPTNPPITVKTLQGQAKRAAQVRRQFHKKGINVIINDFWFLGDDLTIDNPQKQKFPWSVDIYGKVVKGYRCILAAETRKAAVESLIAHASSGVDKIFLDDEVHYDWKPTSNCNEALHFCFCPEHIRAFSRYIEQEMNRDELVKRLQSNLSVDVEVRRKWLAFKRDTFLEFVNHCRGELHKRYPNVRLGQMTTFTHLTAWDGLTFAEHLSALAGKLRPLCRPAQGWYGDQIRTGLPMAIAQTMWTMHCLPDDTEIYSEVDWGSPWTQFESSARMSADLQIKTNLLLNIKTQSLLYFGEGPEDTFIQSRISHQIKKSRPVFDALAKYLPEKAKRIGVQFYMAEKIGLEYPLKCRGIEGDLADPYALTGEGWGLPPWMKCFRCLARTGIPMTFDESPIAVLVGGIAPMFKDSLPEILATKNLIIDAGAAKDLYAMGLLSEFGLRPAKEYSFEKNERLSNDNFNVDAKGEIIPTARIIPPERVVPFKYTNRNHIQHRTISEIIDCNLHVHGAGAVLISNSNTHTRSCVLPFHLSDEGAWGFGVRKRQWKQILEWLSPQKIQLPIWIDDAQDVWPIVYKQDDDKRMWFGLVNFGHDEVNDAICWIVNQSKRSISFINDKGQLQKLPSRFLKKKNGSTGIVLTENHSVKPLDVRLFIA